MELDLLCPYVVEIDEESGKYIFSTDSGGQFEVIFSDINAAFTDTFFEQHDCFTIDVFPSNTLPKGNTNNFVSTLKQIVLHFFKDSSRVMFYQCLTDGKESFRNRKFNFWFSMAEVDNILRKIDTVLTEKESIFHTTMIYHIENTNSTKLDNEFRNFIYEFTEK